MLICTLQLRILLSLEPSVCMAPVGFQHYCYICAPNKRAPVSSLVSLWHPD